MTLLDIVIVSFIVFIRTYQCVDDDHYCDDLTIFRPDVKYHRDSDVQLGDDCDGYYYVKIEYLNPPLQF